MEVGIFPSRQFADGVFWLNDHGTEGGSVGIVDALVVDRNAEEPGRGEGFDEGVDLFERPADGFFAIIDAKEDLGGGTEAALPGRAVLAVAGESQENFLFVPPFVGGMVR